MVTFSVPAKAGVVVNVVSPPAMATAARTKAIFCIVITPELWPSETIPVDPVDGRLSVDPDLAVEHSYRRVIGTGLARFDDWAQLCVKSTNVGILSIKDSIRRARSSV